MARRGRPRSFDRDVALARAMELFWARGYDSTSIADLTAAMGINAPSLYSCFGTKEMLFREAVDRYGATEGAATGRALEEAPGAREAVAAMLGAAVETYLRPDLPAGCMMVTVALGSEAGEGPRRHLVACRQGSVERIRRRLDRGVAEGDLAAGTDTDALAAFYATVLNGLSLLAQDGASKEKLQQVVDCAVTAWDSLTVPGAPSSSGDEPVG